MRSSAETEFVGPLVWLVIGLTGALLWWGVRREHRRAARRGTRLCRACGYDLRASGDLCPECGTVFDPAEGGAAELDPRKLQDDWPASPIAPVPPAVPGDVEVVHRTWHPAEADLVSEQLRARGVWAVVKSKDTYAQAGYAADRVAVLAVAVPPADVEAARAILARFRKPGRSLDPTQD